MQVFQSLEQFDEYYGSAGTSGADRPQTVVALGNFDGVHIGHVEIIRSAVSYAREIGAVPVCYTFSNHPRNMHIDIEGGEEPSVKLIATESDKLAMVEQLGIEVCLSVPFDEDVMHTPAEAFVRDTLYGQLHAGAVCCGFNYRFGARAAGDVDFLQSEGAKYGMKVIAHDPVTVDGEVVSSTAVRELIRQGDMERCAAYLGRPYSLSGKIVYGNEIGRKIGFPTANFEAGHIMMLPPNGVYYSDVVIGTTRYHAITNIGTKPTIGNYVKSVETNLFDFHGDLYGKTIRVELLHHSRPEMKFKNIYQLESQIESDVRDARAYHGME